MNNLDNLRAFVAVVDENSFRRAAAVLYISQPTVSFRIQSLEAEWGAPLLLRRGRRIEMTKLGRRVYPLAKEMLNLGDRITETVAQTVAGSEQKVVIASGSTVGVYLLPRLLSARRDLQTSTQLELQILNSADTFQKLLRHAVDIGILGTSTQHEDLESFHLFSYRLGLAVPADHPLVRRGVTRLEDLLPYPFVMRERGSLARNALDQELRRHPGISQRLRVVLELNSTEALRTATLAGLGLAFLPHWSVYNEVQSGSLVLLPVPLLQLRRDVYVCHNRRSGPHRAAQVYLDFFRSDKIQKHLGPLLEFDQNPAPRLTD